MKFYFSIIAFAFVFLCKGQLIKQKLDSTYTYDPSTMQVEGKSIHSYDKNGNLLTVLGYKRQLTDWINDRKTTYTYFQDSTVINYFSLKNEVFKKNKQEIYIYNNLEQVIEEKHYDINNDIASLDQMTVYTYNTDGQLLSRNNNNSKNLYSYNSENLLSEVIYENNWKYSYSYSILSTITLEYRWNSTNNNWDFEKETISTFTVDKKGDTTSKTDAYRFNNIDPFQNNERFDYTYNQNSDLLSTTEYWWDSRQTVPLWVLTNKKEQTIDPNFNVNEIAHIYTFTGGIDELFDYNSMITNHKTYNKNNEVVFNFDFFYSDFLTGLTNNTESTLQIFPNPSTNHISVNSLSEIIQIHLLNNFGDELLSQKTSPIDIRTITPGHYYLKVETENGVIVKPLIINR